MFIIETSLKFTDLRLKSNPPGASDLINFLYINAIYTTSGILIVPAAISDLD